MPRRRTTSRVRVLTRASGQPSSYCGRSASCSDQISLARRRRHRRMKVYVGWMRSIRVIALAGAVAGVTLVAGSEASASGAAQAVVPQAAGSVFVVPPFAIPYVVAYQDGSHTLGQNGSLFSGGSLGVAAASG